MKSSSGAYLKQVLWHLQTKIKHREHDFFYRDEWQNWLAKKTLTRLDVAFSRDTDQKVYVQQKIEQQASLFYEWLQNGAFVYIFGAVNMGRDVRRAVSAVIQQNGQMPYDEAVAFVEKTEEQGRWHENLY